MTPSHSEYEAFQQAVGETAGTGTGAEGREADADALRAGGRAGTARRPSALPFRCAPTKSSRRSLAGVRASLEGGGADEALAAADAVTAAVAVAVDDGGI